MSGPSLAPLEPARRSTRFTRFGAALALLAASILALTAPLAPMLAVAPALVLLAVLAAPALAWLHLRGLRVAPPSAATAFAGEGFALSVRISNRSRLFAARDVALREEASPGRPRLHASAWISSLPPGEAREVSCAWRLARRGRVSACALVASSSFPLGLAESRASFLLPADLVALPRLGSLRDLAGRLAPRSGAQRERRATRQGDEEFRGLREWREGESQRLVHWKVSAHRGRLVVRELEGEERPPVRLCLWGFVPAGAPTAGARGADRAAAPRARRAPAPRAARADPFEEAVSLAATLAEYLVRRRYRVRFTFAGESAFELDVGASRHGLMALLRALAEVEPAPRPAPVPPRRFLRRVRRRGETAVLVWVGGASAAALIPAGEGLVLDVHHPSTSEIYSPARRATPLAALAQPVP